MRLPRVRIPRPSLSRGAGAADKLQAGPVDRTAADEDARLLRRTRVRLMAVSGFVTLVILVGLGVATYQVVFRALDESDRTALQHYVDRHRINQTSNTGPEATELGGEGSNMFEIYVTSTGSVLPPRGQKIPAGLPDPASLAAALANANGIDTRLVTGPDGTPYTIETVQAIGPNGTDTWLIQFIQNRTAEARLLSTLFWILLLGGAAALLAALVAGYVYAGRALVPIRESIGRRQAALQRQREFTANASHELRTPLTVIRTSVEDLRRNRRKRVDEVGEALDDIDAEVRHVTALVEDMLLLARTDSGVVQIERVPLDLADEAAEAASLLGSLGTDRGVAVMLDPLPAPINGDAVRLRQLVTILVDNAIRHSTAGSAVEVLVRMDAGTALLEVLDQGPGIRPEDLPHLWERFWQADNAPAGGTGLGLSIAKWIVDQHGGAIGAENRPEGGARFWVRLPARGADKLTVAPDPWDPTTDAPTDEPDDRPADPTSETEAEPSRGASAP